MNSTHCRLYKIIFWIELDETEKDCSKEGEFLKSELEGTMTKTATLCCRLTKLSWGSNWVWLINYGFGYMSIGRYCLLGQPHLRGKVLVGLRSDARHVVARMQHKKVGHQAVRKVSSVKYPNTNLLLAATADNRHTSIMANTSLQSFKMPSTSIVLVKRCWDWLNLVHAMVFFGRHSVDNNYSNLWGWLFLEKVSSPNWWDLSQLRFISALAQLNSLLASNYFNCLLHMERFFQRQAYLCNCLVSCFHQRVLGWCSCWISTFLD